MFTPTNTPFLAVHKLVFFLADASTWTNVAVPNGGRDFKNCRSACRPVKTTKGDEPLTFDLEEVTFKMYTAYFIARNQ
jgi:hypothetical protein